ncbi:MAG TPA: uroporphyrinogen-III C-methyltransferase [Dokdonella sp.]|uniref:uroporphyrinogen-III C-methyltransferase n=1 Tax=Dokdonella sp. TaxID=2291710 RepID=UPI0025C5897B|nr:uroporphyrinogen-III C-methyltransferase [Dokdonella sp.]MBX3691408.1 uroporphyrinogen-III C-methyltransferase [Dokdonella sp.]MCW5567867.1 uroporphyrinogen-III C-methyltransferase [Dokdonella sp.]HNR91967.1 uroporphyrinogen-III C-methyltransferase [Dokdonella sp.]
MENDTRAELPAPTQRSEGSSDVRPATPPRRGGARGLLFVIVVLAVAATAFWWLRETREQGAQQAGVLDARVEALASSGEQLKREVESLRARLADAESINRSLREELLGAAERARAVEDAVAHLADQRLTGRDALALNEAEFLLQIATERLRLFHDAAAAITAYRLADSALAAAEDPLFASVRQTIGAEIAALEAAQSLRVQPTLDALANLRARLVNLPSRANGLAAPAVDPPESRFARVFGQFVRVSRTDAQPTFEVRDAAITRSLAALDLRAAEAALFARDAEAFTAALVRARGGVTAAFDTDAEAVRNVLGEIDRLAATPMAPQLPELGSALGELRNLRTLRALSREVPPPVQDSSR